MAITINNGVQNILGTPGAISGVFANRPAAANVADGTLYFSTDTLAIYQAISGAWQAYSGGGGGGITNANNGLSVFGGNTAQLGGTLVKNTTINAANFDLFYTNGRKYNIDAQSYEFTNSNLYKSLSSDGSSMYVGCENLAGTVGVSMWFDRPNEKIYTLFNSTYTGLNLDFANNYFTFGDYNAINNGNFIVFDDQNNEIFLNNNNITQIYINQNIINLGYLNGIDFSVYLDYSNAQLYCRYQNQQIGVIIKPNQYYYGFGTGGYGNVINFEINDQFQQIITSLNYSALGLKIDFANSSFYLGDFDGLNNGTNIVVNDNTARIGLTANDQLLLYGGNYVELRTSLNSSLMLDNNISKFGDTINTGNSSIFGVDDSNQTLIASFNLIVGTSGSSSGQHLKINVGGTDYVIELKNP